MMHHEPNENVTLLHDIPDIIEKTLFKKQFYISEK